MPYAKRSVAIFLAGADVIGVDWRIQLDDVLLHRVEANDVITIGNFKVEFIHASHSLVECFSLAIHTPIGTIIHTGDYKIDDTPVIGKPYDLKTLGRIGDEGVLALLCDSTNATVPGRTPSAEPRRFGWLPPLHP